MDTRKAVAICNTRNASLSFFVLCSTLLFSMPHRAKAQPTDEKKVDYLESVYFSGENKEGLNTKILLALQEIQKLNPTPALARQVTFLLDIKQKSGTVGDACDILDMLAAGIYNIDAAEAVSQGVKPPSDKGKKNSADAIANLDKLASSTGNLSSTARIMAWDSYLLSGGNYGGFAAGANKLANTAGVVSNVAGVAGKTKESIDQVDNIRKSLGISFKKDKPCKDVSPKVIPIGLHAGPAAPTAVATNKAENKKEVIPANLSTTVISIMGINSSSLRSLTDSLRSKTGVHTVEKTYNETASTITVQHTGSTDAVADWLEDKFGTHYKLLNYSVGKINLAPRPKK